MAANERLCALRTKLGSRFIVALDRIVGQRRIELRPPFNMCEISHHLLNSERHAGLLTRKGSNLTEKVVDGFDLRKVCWAWMSLR